MFANKFVKYAVTAPKSSIRLMSGHKGTPAEMRADVNRWKQISVGEINWPSLSLFTSFVFKMLFENQKYHSGHRLPKLFLALISALTRPELRCSFL